MPENMLRAVSDQALQRLATQAENAATRLLAQRELERRRTVALWARDARP